VKVKSGISLCGEILPEAKFIRSPSPKTFISAVQNCFISAFQFTFSFMLFPFLVCCWVEWRVLRTLPFAFG
jgi:hypothetical protein